MCAGMSTWCKCVGMYTSRNCVGMQTLCKCVGMYTPCECVCIHNVLWWHTKIWSHRWDTSCKCVGTCVGKHNVSVLAYRSGPVRGLAASCKCVGMYTSFEFVGILPLNAAASRSGVDNIPKGCWHTSGKCVGIYTIARRPLCEA